MSKELAERGTIEELVRVYRQAEADIHAGFALVNRAQNALGDAFSNGGDPMRMRPSYRHALPYSFAEPVEAMREIRRTVWRCLIERLQIRKAMSVEAWKKLSHEVEDGEPPEVTVEMVEGVVCYMRDQLPAMLEEAVTEVFEILRPRRSKYKTNTECEVGEKVVLSYFVEQWSRFQTRWEVNHHREQELTALENVFRMLDGSVAESKGFYSDLSSAIRACRENTQCAGQTEYFEFKGFKNGNLHITFRRLDLVAKLNRIAGGARLKPVEAAA